MAQFVTPFRFPRINSSVFRPQNRTRNINRTEISIDSQNITNELPTFGDSNFLKYAKNVYGEYFNLFSIENEFMYDDIYDKLNFKEVFINLDNDKIYELYYNNTIDEDNIKFLTHVSIACIIFKKYSYTIYLCNSYINWIVNNKTELINSERYNSIKLLLALAYQYSSNFQINGYYYISLNIYRELMKQNTAKYNYFMGLFYSYFNKQSEAIIYFKKGIEQNCKKCIITLANLYMNIDRHNGNLEHKEDICQLFNKLVEKGNNEGYLGLAEYYQNIKDYKNAIEHYHKCIEFGVGSGIHLKIAKLGLVSEFDDFNNDDYFTLLYEGVLKEEKECILELHKIDDFVLVNIFKDLLIKGRVKYNKKILSVFLFAEKDVVRRLLHHLVFKPLNQTSNTSDTSDNSEPSCKKGKESDDNCCICYDEYDLCITQCKHIICKDCSKKLENDSCPMCRTNLYDFE